MSNEPATQSPIIQDAIAALLIPKYSAHGQAGVHENAQKAVIALVSDSIQLLR
jgi:hypothetical protein